MRISREICSQAVPLESPFKKPIKDMQNLFGGKVARNGFFSDSYLSDARNSVSAFTQKASREAIISIKEPETPSGALGWTAVQAYRAKGGLPLGSLVTAVPGLRGYQEHTNRTLKTFGNALTELAADFKAKSDALTMDLLLSESDFNRRCSQLDKEEDQRQQEIRDSYYNAKFFAGTGYAPGQDPLEQYFEGLKANLKTQFDASNDKWVAVRDGDPVRAEMADREYRQALEAANRQSTIDVVDTSKHTASLFYAEAPDVPTAARMMAEGYGRLAFHSDDPDAAVARALGVPNLTELDQVWDEAMAQPTPLLAGRFILTSFH